MMLWTIAAALTILWLLGMITSTMMGGYIHVLLVIAVIAVTPYLFRGKNRRRLKLPDETRNRRAYSHFTERKSLGVW